MSDNARRDRQAYISTLEERITEHEDILSEIHEKIAHLHEAERQDNIKLFIERTGLTIAYGDILNVTAQFDDYVKAFLETEDRYRELTLWNERKEGALTIYNYELDDVFYMPIIDARWTEVEFRKAGAYFEDRETRLPLHSIPFRDIPLHIIKACLKEDES